MVERVEDAARRFGRWMLTGWMVFIILVSLHIWQESQGKDGATVWSCHTMGERHCGPQAGWLGITINWGGVD